jgi:hypothetical protein
VQEREDSIPPDDLWEEWIKRNTAILRQALSEPTTRKRIIELLNGEEHRRPGNDDETLEDS